MILAGTRTRLPKKICFLELKMLKGGSILEMRKIFQIWKRMEILLLNWHSQSLGHKHEDLDR